MEAAALTHTPHATRERIGLSAVQRHHAPLCGHSSTPGFSALLSVAENKADYSIGNTVCRTPSRTAERSRRRADHNTDTDTDVDATRHVSGTPEADAALRQEPLNGPETVGQRLEEGRKLRLAIALLNGLQDTSDDQASDAASLRARIERTSGQARMKLALCLYE